MAQVVLENLTKRFREVLAVDNLNLQIGDRELVVLVGPSGCGKSTTLRMIAGLEEISSGTIRIGERIVNTVPAKDRNIAMVFQNYALYPHMTVHANMAFGLQMRKVNNSEIERRVREAAAILGIDNLLDRRPKHLSGGQRQRVALGRAIVRKPDVFLFDEPLSNLDARLRVTMRTELVKLHRQLQATTIHVTHDQVEAMTMGDRIVVMKDGRIEQLGTPFEVYNSPASRFIGEFIGSPPMNFLTGRFVANEGTLGIDVKDFQLTLPREHGKQLATHAGRAVLLGVRPENISTRPDAAKGQWHSVPARAVVSQLLGAESIVELETGQQRFMARVDPETKIAPGELLEVFFDATKCHVFDAATEQRL